MKERLDIIAYSAQSHEAKHYSFNPLRIKRLVFMLCLLLLLFAGGFFVVLFQKALLSNKPEELIRQQQLAIRQDYKATLEQNKALIEQQSQLVAKLNTSDSVIQLFPLIKSPKGMLNRQAEDIVQLDRVTLTPKNNSAQLKFHLVNKSQRLQKGTFFVVSEFPELVHLYPTSNRPDAKAYFTDGESFTMSYMRPVSLTLNYPLNTSKLKQLRVFVFSQTGDLLLEKIITPSA